jgi:hypothetical protein
MSLGTDGGALADSAVVLCDDSFDEDCEESCDEDCGAGSARATKVPRQSEAETTRILRATERSLDGEESVLGSHHPGYPLPHGREWACSLIGESCPSVNAPPA